MGRLPTYLHGSVLLVRRHQGRSELWVADVFDAGTTEETVDLGRPMRIQNHEWIGDRTNPAVFFLERYLPGPANISIDDLAFVAAYIITSAAKLNPAGIRGIEILLCPHGAKAFELVSEDKIADLIKRSDQLDDEIARRLGIVPQPVGRW